MTGSLIDNEWFQVVVFFAVLLACVKPLGAYMASVYSGDGNYLGCVECLFAKLTGIDPEEEMSWREYVMAVLTFSFMCFLALYASLRLQGYWGPEISPDLAFNTAVSFVTNTDWQAYSGEKTMTASTQMTALTVESFLSAATGLAIMAAVIRGFTRVQSKTIGNFWADLMRGVLYILLPLSVLLALALAGMGVVQTLAASIDAAWLDPSASDAATQKIALGPAASQVAIKMLGSNGGGFFGANAAHPFENPTPLTNFVETLAILLIPAAQCYTFGRMAKDTRHGWVLLIAMFFLFVPMFLFAAFQEQRGNPLLTPLGVEQTQGNMEGKEVRFGVVNSALWASAATAASSGSTNASMDSLMPLASIVPLAFMQIGEVVFGGVGCGLYSMLIFVIVTVFITGLMVGRTPEYLSKKIEVFDMKMAALTILTPPLCVLLGTALAVSLDVGKDATLNPSAQAFSEILYAFSSASNNNGSAMGGLAANTPFYNVTLGLAMLIGRFGTIVPVLALAGSMAHKNVVPQSVGTLPTTTPTFSLMLIGIIVTSGVLTFIPSLTLGPVAEFFRMAGTL